MRKHFIVGTAGHVDHGKSSLIRALTGTETDRLPEEKARGLSIDLGFACLALPGDVTAGIVDVPGHERFLKNMLAGVGGYDAAMLVIDAGEGVMPQTREHLDILQLLGTPRGLVVITKRDTVDPEFLELVCEEVKELVAATFLEGAPLLQVSSKTGQGLDELLGALTRLLGAAPPRPSEGPARLPVDRSFTRPGFGTVVTGSLWSGQLTRGDRLQLWPAGEEVKIRGLQVHGQDVEQAFAGQRVAVNLAGLPLEQARRGMLLATPDWLTPSSRVDMRLEIPARVPRPLKHRAGVRVYQGTAETLGRALLLDSDELLPGSSGLVQLVTETPLLSVTGDRVVLRDSTSSYTLAGGVVLEPHAEPHRRKEEETLRSIDSKARGDLQGRVAAALVAEQPRPLTTLSATLQLSAADVLAALEAMEREGEAIRLPRGWVNAAGVEQVSEALLGLLGKLAQSAGWKGGWRRDELLKLLSHPAPKFAEEVLLRLVAQGQVEERGRLLCLAGHRPHLNARQAAWVESVRGVLRAGENSPAAWGEMAGRAGLDAQAWKIAETYLLDSGEAVKLGPELVYLAETLAAIRSTLEGLPAGWTAAAARDALNTSRKFVIPLLEHSDAQGWTRREGELRFPA